MDRATFERIEKALCYPGGSIKLRADGHDVSVQVRRISSKVMRYAPLLFVDGYLKVENLRADSEVGAKFYPLRTRCVLPTKEIDSYRKLFGKRQAEAFRKRATVQSREFHFRSGRAVAMHLKKHCQSVEIVEDAP